MNFNHYQQRVAEQGHNFSANHQPGWELFLATGLCEETGEVTKIIRNAYLNGLTPGANALAEELGDVLHYIAYIAYRNGLSLEKIAEDNIKYKEVK